MTVDIYFEPDSAAVTKEGRAVLRAAADQAKGCQVDKVLVLVRKEPKGYGTSKQIEGHLTAGDRVTVIEDVVTTGGDSLRSAQVLRDAGANVIHLIVVLDRGEGGEDNIRNAGIPYTPLFRIQDLELD